MEWTPGLVKEVLAYRKAGHTVGEAEKHFKFDPSDTKRYYEHAKKFGININPKAPGNDKSKRPKRRAPVYTDLVTESAQGTTPRELTVAVLVPVSKLAQVLGVIG
jgi:hypothetical protein